MTMLPYLLMALLAGFCPPVQTGINMTLNLWTKSSIISAGISFAVGTLTLFLFIIVVRVPLPPVETLSRHPWWMWTGGVLGAFFVASMIYLGPELGASVLLATIVAGQMSASMLLDHFGWLQFPHQPITPLRLLGIALIVVGVFLVRR
jgi:transporter family-2 protein